MAQAKGTQKIADLSGLTRSHPALGWGFVLAVAAIAGLPPMGLFMSEFLVVTSAMARQPWLAVPVVLGLLVAFGALVLRLQHVAFGEPRGPSEPIKASLAPLYLHLALVLTAGLWLPPPLVAWFQNVARLLGQ
jgi:hydrogenase-4 component F